MPNYDYAYLIGAFLAAPIWLGLYVFRRDLRREMLIISLIGGALGVIFAPAVQSDYWHPHYVFGSSIWPLSRLEDFIYCFFTIGIASVVYEVLFAKHFKRSGRQKSFSRFVIPAILIYILSFYIPYMLGLNSLQAAFIGFGAVVGIIIFIRHDLLADALLSGLLMGVMVMVGYILFLKLYPDIFNRFFYLDSFSGHSLLGIPLEEVAWAFGLGAIAGPSYEFFARRKFAKN